MKIEFIVGGISLLIGTLSAWRSLSAPAVEEDARSRFLIAIHDAAKAGFWLALGAFFLAYGLLDEPQSIRYVALVPIALAGVRLLTAAFLARS